MDRQYTERFFFGAPRTFNSLAFQNRPRDAFVEALPSLAAIAEALWGAKTSSG
jgi:hypothetical protein